MIPTRIWIGPQEDGKTDCRDPLSVNTTPLPLGERDDRESSSLHSNALYAPLHHQEKQQFSRAWHQKSL
ncbi:hypothetical protein PsorP6_001769 [Peronosclerospora sorghi]|uniref:Uncharacterized protein n=1 Tax=Peronosclerospora sorghi TaxID=230839 RepID=A0ACC0WVC6_9STRA|nr:hypothetical protein PsorP6_001769 [Peronosclerospora sorghi]